MSFPNKKQTTSKRKKYIIIGLVIIVALFCTLFIINKVMDKHNHNDNIIENQNKFDFKESPYTLDELYEIIEKNKLYDLRFTDEGNEIGYILMNFYDYFNKSTKFMVAKELDDSWKPISFKYITYEEYQKSMIEYKENWLHPDGMKTKNIYYMAAKDFIQFSNVEKIGDEVLKEK